MSICLFNGAAVFGVANHAPMNPAQPAIQYASFFGVPGMTAKFGGSRGRTWSIRGVLVAPDLPTLNAVQISLQSLIENMTPGTFTDSQGNSWPYCLFDGTVQWHPEGPKITDSDWILPFAGLRIRSIQ